jgi:tricorn protease
MKNLLFALLSCCAAGMSAAASIPPAPLAATDETRLLRFPATDGRQIVFSYAGQLYTVALDGGVARRLTDGPGYAVFPRFSADGSQLAFTAQYDGNTEVYVMSPDGGIPRRLTYSATLSRDDLADRMGPNNIVLAWRNTAPEIAFRSRWHSFNPFIGELYTVGLDADLPKRLPVPRGGFLSFSPDDTKIAYNRVFREFRTWKQYRGGMADDIWIYDLKSGALENITNNPAQDIIPMWAPNGKIYFLSERDGRANLFAYTLATKQTEQFTHFSDFDIKFPSLGKGGIVFEQGGSLWFFDLATEKARRVPVNIREDFAARRPALVKVASQISEVSLSPDAQRAVVVARGDVFTVPHKYGPTRNLTQSSGAHERGATWSPDGKWIAYVSDASGEYELYVQAQDGTVPAVQLSTGSSAYFFAPNWSPDSKKLLWYDAKRQLRFIDVATKEITLVAELPEQRNTRGAWAPDSQWIAYTEEIPMSVERIVLYSVAAKTRTYATDAWYSANSPVFSDDGKWLLFSSARDFRPIYSDTEWNHAYQDMERVYLLALAKGTPSPLAPKSDETGVAKVDDSDKADKAEAAENAEKNETGDKPELASSDKPKSGNKKAEAKKIVVQVDLDGLSERVVGLPVQPSNYGSLRMIGEKVYYHRVAGGPVGGGGGGEGFGAIRNTRSMVAVFDLKERKEIELGNFDAFSISKDGKKALLKNGRDFGIVDLPTGSAKLELKEKLDFGGLEARVDRSAEWAQVFDESWRQMRDFFYAPNMHGVDWPAQRAKYGALLPYANSRNDVTYLIGEMISELHIGHTYVGTGERPEAPHVQMGLLGAELSRDPATRAYRIDRILKGDNWQSQTRSPLTELGVKVSEGDYILAVNGKPVDKMENIYAALIDTAGKQVTLRVSSAPANAETREVVVVPIADESSLYYEAWVRKNTDYVSSKTGNEVGYLYIPDMGPEGLNEFVRRFYPQLNKRALIIDVRGNGGGNVSPMIIERLRREVAMIQGARYGSPRPNPGDQLVGPKVTLLNEYSASDGDLFSARFREHRLGKLIGKRSWGGVVGIPGSLPFVDGGSMNIPSSGPYAKDGSKWIIEGHGVDPDIVVDNDPAKEFAGGDQQLDKAIEVILEELKSAPAALPPRPDWPNKK